MRLCSYLLASPAMLGLLCALPGGLSGCLPVQPGDDDASIQRGPMPGPPPPTPSPAPPPSPTEAQEAVGVMPSVCEDPEEPAQGLVFERLLEQDDSALSVSVAGPLATLSAGCAFLQCDGNAVCVEPEFPGEVPRCECLEGFVGDGSICCPEDALGGVDGDVCACYSGEEGYRYDSGRKLWSGRCPRPEAGLPWEATSCLDVLGDASPALLCADPDTPSDQVTRVHCQAQLRTEGQIQADSERILDAVQATPKGGTVCLYNTCLIDSALFIEKSVRISGPGVDMDSGLPLKRPKTVIAWSGRPANALPEHSGAMFTVRAHDVYIGSLHMRGPGYGSALLRNTHGVLARGPIFTVGSEAMPIEPGSPPPGDRALPGANRFDPRVAAQAATDSSAAQAGTPLSGADLPIRNTVVCGNIIQDVRGRGVTLSKVDGAIVQRNTIRRAGYAGIDMATVKNVLVDRNAISEIGTPDDPCESISFPSNGPDPWVLAPAKHHPVRFGNAFGVTVTGCLTPEDCSENVEISHNFVSDVHQWVGLQNHGGVRVRFVGNWVTDSSRAFMLTTTRSTAPSHHTWFVGNHAWVHQDCNNPETLCDNHPEYESVGCNPVQGCDTNWTREARHFLGRGLEVASLQPPNENDMATGIQGIANVYLDVGVVGNSFGPPPPESAGVKDEGGRLGDGDANFSAYPAVTMDSLEDYRMIHNVLDVNQDPDGQRAYVMIVGSLSTNPASPSTLRNVSGMRDGVFAHNRVVGPYNPSAAAQSAPAFGSACTAQTCDSRLCMHVGTDATNPWVQGWRVPSFGNLVAHNDFQACGANLVGPWSGEAQSYASVGLNGAAWLQGALGVGESLQWDVVQSQAWQFRDNDTARPWNNPKVQPDDPNSTEREAIPELIWGQQALADIPDSSPPAPVEQLSLALHDLHPSQLPLQAGDEVTLSWSYPLDEMEPGRETEAHDGFLVFRTDARGAQEEVVGYLPPRRPSHRPSLGSPFATLPEATRFRVRLDYPSDGAALGGFGQLRYGVRVLRGTAQSPGVDAPLQP